VDIDPFGFAGQYGWGYLEGMGDLSRWGLLRGCDFCCVHFFV